MKIFDCDAKDYKDQYVLNISGEFLNEIPINENNSIGFHNYLNKIITLLIK